MYLDYYKMGETMSCTNCCNKDKLAQGEIENPGLDFITKARNSEVEKNVVDNNVEHVKEVGEEEIT